MKNRHIALWVLLAVAVVGGLTALALTVGEHLSPPEEEPASFELVHAAPEEITAIAAESASGSVALVRTLEAWTDPEVPAMPLDQSWAEETAAALAGLTGSRVAGDEADPAAYGLRDPTATYVLTADGEEQRLAIGDTDPYTGLTYVALAHLTGVYTADLRALPAVPERAEALALYEPFALPGEITALTVERGGERTEAIPFDPAAPQTFREGCSWVLPNAYGALAAREEGMEAILQAAEELEFLACRRYAPTAEELSAWGFDDPVTVTLTAGAGETSLTIGGSDGAGHTYVRRSGDGSVYLAAETLTETLAFRREDLEVVNPLLGVDPASVVSVTVQGALGNYVFQNDETGRAAIEAVLALSSGAADRAGETFKLAAQATITVQRDTEFFSTLTLELVPFNEELYLVRTWGTERNFVTAADVNALFETFNTP